MTGLDLGKAIRSLSKDVSIILTSGNLDPQLQLEFESLGFSGFVRKPWTAPEMLRVINSMDVNEIKKNKKLTDQSLSSHRTPQAEGFNVEVNTSEFFLNIVALRAQMINR